MLREDIRNALANYCDEWQLEEGERPLLLDGFDESIIGITEDFRVVYSYEKMVQEYAKDNECSYEDAIEWIDYNTMRAIPYFGEHRPIVYHEIEAYL